MSTLSASAALQAAIKTALTANAALISLLGGVRIFDDVPRGVPFPYVTIGQTQVKDWSTGTEPGEEHILTLHIWSRYGGRLQTHELIAAIKSALHDAALSLPGYTLINLRQEFSDARRDPDGETYHGIVRLRAVTEPQP